MSGQTPYRPGPIVPPEAAPLKSLTVTMAVMCYLACLAIGALILIDRAVESWTGGLSREVTVQVRPLQSADVEAELARAEALLASFPGIVATQTLDRAAAKLLEPWLGNRRSADSAADPCHHRCRAPPDFAALDAALKAKSRCRLDTHALAGGTHPHGRALSTPPSRSCFLSASRPSPW
jgi:cell division transport system permease protein